MNPIKITPMHLDALIEGWYSIQDKPESSPFDKEFFYDLADLELVQENKDRSSGYEATAKGENLLLILCSAAEWLLTCKIMRPKAQV